MGQAVDLMKSVSLLFYVLVFFGTPLWSGCNTASNQSELFDMEQDPSAPSLAEIFRMASEIDFYWYHQKDEDSRALLRAGGPYCNSGAVVTSDQIRKKFPSSEVGIAIITFTDVYINHCTYPTSYEWHTVSTVKEGGETYIIDPFHAPSALPTKEFLTQLILRECGNLSTQKIEQITDSVDGGLLEILDAGKTYEQYLSLIHI